MNCAVESRVHMYILRFGKGEGSEREKESRREREIGREKKRERQQESMSHVACVSEKKQKKAPTKRGKKQSARVEFLEGGAEVDVLIPKSYQHPRATSESPNVGKRKKGLGLREHQL